MNSAIQWIGHSNRFYHGEPDTRFGWYRLESGTAVIVKALNPTAHVHAELVAQYEEAMLVGMHATGLAVPRLLKREGCMLHIEFAGLSLRALSEMQPVPLSPEELAQLFQHLCRRGYEFAQAGVLHLDVWAANIVIPLEQDTEGGRLCLDQPIYIDCSNSLSPETVMRRPPWISRKTPHIAPEVRRLLTTDQDRMVRAFRRQGLELRSLPNTSPEEFLRLGQLYRAYSAPQMLTQALADGEVDPDTALQYAMGLMLQQLLAVCSAPGFGGLATLAERLTQPEPADRYPDLEAAAVAFAALCPEHASFGQHVFPPVCPEHILAAAAPGSAPPTTGALAWRDSSHSDDGVNETACLGETIGAVPARRQWSFSWGGIAVAVFLAAAFFLGGYHGPADPVVALEEGERRRIELLAGQLKNGGEAYAAALQQLQALAGHGQLPSSQQAQLQLTAEIARVRRALGSGLLRESLPTRLLQRDTAAQREWRQLRPRLQALVRSGYQEFERWLDYADAAALGKPTLSR